MSSVFDFIVGDDFRQSIESDFRELQAAVDAKSWKSVHVLAGSIIEAILIDYLVAKKPAGIKNPLSLDLAAAIDACAKEGVLSERTSALCHVVRSYRNLIHPGRTTRLEEPPPDEQSAMVARALVEMIAGEVSKTRAIEFGLTADQLCQKLVTDRTATPIIGHLLDRLSSDEMKTLLLTTLPARYLEHLQWATPEEPIPASFEACFGLAMDKASESLQRNVVARLVEVVRKEAEETVVAYETAFFRGAYLPLVPKQDQDLMKTHLISQLEKEPSPRLIRVLKGSAPYLNNDEIRRLMYVCLKPLVGPHEAHMRAAAVELVSDLYGGTTDEGKARIRGVLDGWIEFYESKKRESVVEAIRSVVDALEIPF